MSDAAIRVEHLGKRYLVGRRERYRTLRDSVAEAAGSSLNRIGRALRGGGWSAGAVEADLLWALRDVSLTVGRGEVLGVIGRNGAGKSTFLKILSRITDPTEGWAEIRGRVGSLLEVGTGFHPELTGRENIFLNGAILGMRRTEITRSFDEIVAFAETDRFIDTPVKHYSSGMQMRLAFAVAAHLQADVLLVDEVLAVGDAAFQKRCMGKIGDIAHAGKTVLFVSHHLEAIQRLCPRCILLHGGQVEDDGPTPAVVARYLSTIAGRARPQEWIALDGVARSGSGLARFVAIQYSSDRAAIGFQPYTKGRLEVGLLIRAAVGCDIGGLAVTIYSQLGTKLVNADVGSHERILHLSQGLNEVRVEIDRLFLNPGVYRMGLWLADPANDRYSGGAHDYIETAFEIEVLALDTDAAGMQADGAVACDFAVSDPTPVNGDGG